MRGDFHIGDWLVQPQLNRICRSTETTRLEPKAMAVLMCLARHQDEVVTKEQLKKEVWPNTHVTNHVLVRCISDLRRAFRDDPREPKIIQTISRGGYRLMPPTVDTASRSNGQGPPVRIHADAVENYLKGRYCYEQRSHASLLRAVAHLEKAVATDPRFARAYAALADCYALIAQSGFENPDFCYIRSKAASLKALNLDHCGAEPHVSLALARMCHDLEWDEAEAGFRKAVELDPEYACAHHWLAFCLLARRRTAEAIRQAETARSLDPVSLVFAGMLVRALLAAGNHGEGVDVCLEMLELRPASPDLEWLLCESYWYQGKHEQARLRLKSMQGSECQDGMRLAVYNAVFSGETDKAIRELHRLVGRVELEDPISWAKASAWVGETDRAFKWLDCAFERKDTGVLLLDADPGFTGLRSEPRFGAMLQKLRLH